MADVWSEFTQKPAEASSGSPPAVSPDSWAFYTSPGTSALPAAPVDKYRAAALAERDKLVRAGVDTGAGYTQRLGRGATLGWLDEAMAAGTTPLEMIRRGTLDPREGYRYAKAREDLINEDTDRKTAGVLGTGTELLGGLGTGAGVMRAAVPRAIPFTNRAIPAGVVNWGRGVGTGAGIGALAGAGEAPDIEGIPKGMMMGGVLGAGVGAVLPPAIQLGSAVAGQTMRGLQFPRLRDPVKVADERVATAARDAGMTPQELAQRVADANAAGQPYTVADAIGKEGQRALTAQAKMPGEQRNLIAETLTTRDLNMPHRVGGEIGQGMGAPGSAEASRELLMESAKRGAAPLYRQAEAHPTWSNRLQEFLDDPIAKQGLRRGIEIQRLEAVGNGRPFNPWDLMVTDFNAAGEKVISNVPNVRGLHAIKVGVDRMIEAEQNPLTGSLTSRGRALLQYRDGLLREMDTINPTYGAARKAYAGPMQIRDAVREGQRMPNVGRAEDNIRAFRDMSPTEQQGARIGYADTVRGKVERGDIPSILRQKNTKGAAELGELSLYQGPSRPGEPDQMRKFLNREEQMKQTSNSALGGSSTAENLADMNAASNVVGDVAGLIGSAASGNPLSFTQRAIGMLGSVAKGESSAQRLAITRALLERDPNAIKAMAARIAAREARAAELMRRANR
ncbi:MAG: hypothetical protein ABWY64_07500 [Tardiphaga sp.]